ncbi:DUF262 domain-containing protein [Hymenobacter aerophilus]|uniref:DUF262 domain-containing protein n=1 Tax=Hymenobacter aerophilus TaxID=119644 RepID=UPI0003A6CC98|nr:DUF262 domain-containing protein [Hymenobacter aerophilus]
MKANETKIDKFLATNETTFTIPVYQRNYDWSLVQCKQLLLDILEAGGSDKISAHFIGSIVYVHDDVYVASGLTELTIIDGQQRLTTITLIYVAMYSYAKSIGNDKLANRIYKTYLINEYAPDEEKLKLKPTDNNQAALKYILGYSDDVEFKGYSRLVDNFIYFKSTIDNLNFEIIQKGLSKLIFIDISLDRQKDNPQRIFESLNSTGLELSQADLIRNYILMGLNRVDQDKVYKKYWDVIEYNAKDEKTNSSKVSEFIRDYLTLKNKEIPNKGDVYLKFKNKFPTGTIEYLEETLIELRSLVKYYNKLNNPKHEADNDIRIQLEYINRLEINVAYPFLMKVYEDYSQGVIDKDSFVSLLLTIQSFVFRRFLLGLTTNALNKIFMTLYDKIDKENYLISFQKSLLQRSGNQRFPKDIEVVNALKEKDLYNIKTKNRTYLFEKLENYNNKEYISVEDSSLTVEHIFPQNPESKWKSILGSIEYSFIKESLLNTIGNLTLSGNNGKLGNKTFIEKREMNFEGKEQGYKFSRLWLNRDLKDYKAWGKKEIHERCDTISNRFLKVWALPQVKIDSDDDNGEINIFDAEEPKNKKLEYAIFFDEKLNVTQVSKLYIEVIKRLFELQPGTFFAPEISAKIKLSKDPNADNLRQPVKINDSYFIESNIDNVGKFDRIKIVLKVFGFEDELLIKYDNKKESTQIQLQMNGLL